jgi:ATP-dependent RNA helicase DDX60
MNLTLSATRPMTISRTEWLSNAASAFLDSVEADDTLSRPLLYVFLAHALILHTIPLSLRAQPLPILFPEMESYLREKFLPLLFECLERSVPDKLTFHDTDLDGRLFLHLLQAVPSGLSTSEVMANLIGPTAASELGRLWKVLGNGTEFSLLTPVRSGVFEVLKRENNHDAFSVLHFSHPILDEHLAKVQVNAVSLSDSEPGKLGLDSGLGIVFQDSMHWHNSRKPILPKHMGGEDLKSTPPSQALLARARRRDQKFQASLEKHAQTLTGAFGKEIESIVIPRGIKAVVTKKTVRWVKYVILCA